MGETVLKIRAFPDPVLRKKAMAVKEVTLGYHDILSRMAQAMYEHSGVGLAGPQVGISESLIVADIGSGLYKLINPRIIKRQGSQVTEEGCLSVPGVCVKVKRAKRIKLEALDEEGKTISLEAQDLLACVFQHEIDHLNGRLIIDHASLWKKLKIRKKLNAVCRLQL